MRRLVIGALLLASGCVAIPLATPPVQLGIGGQIRASEPLDRPSRAAWSGGASVRAAIHPLGFAPTLLDRRIDFGAGYLLDLGPAPLQGAFLEFAAAPLRVADRDHLFRFSARAQYRLLFDQAQAMGQGAALQLAAEYASFIDGPFNVNSPDGGAFGQAFGESSVGMFLELSAFEIARERGASLTGGILIRMPALFGFAWGWLK